MADKPKDDHQVQIEGGWPENIILVRDYIKYRISQGDLGVTHIVMNGQNLPMNHPLPLGVWVTLIPKTPFP